MIPNVYRGKVLSTLNWIEGYHAAVGDRHYISLPLDITSTEHVAISDFADSPHAGRGKKNFEKAFFPIA